MTVIGCDVSAAVVDKINSGHSHVLEESGLEEAVAGAVSHGLLRATQDTSAAVAWARTVVVIVPVVVNHDKSVDFGHLDAATDAVGKGLKKDTLVIFETTVPVGTTRARIAPRLESASGLKVGRDFHLAYSPERIYAGRIFEDLRRYPKIVGGVDAASTTRAQEFYGRALDAEVRTVENAETAEFCKLAETTYRDVNIALANQLALYAAGREVNVAQAFASANSQPFSHLHKPSIGVGGHCIPVYPHFLLSDAVDGELSLVRLGRATNDSMVDRSVEAIRDVLGGLQGRRVLVLGVSYREDVKETAFSTAIPLVERLHREGAHVLVHDPLFDPSELKMLDAEFVDATSGGSIDVDAAVVQAYHRQYRDLDWSRFKGLKLVFDGRGSVDGDMVRKTGARYLAVGLPL